MNAVVATQPLRKKAAAPAAPNSVAADPVCGAGALLAEVFAALEAGGVPYCVLHGYKAYFDAVPSDVDCLVPASAMGKLAAALRSVDGARIVQWVVDGAHFVVLARQDGRGEGGPGSPSIVQLHVSPHYEMAGRVFYSADEILSTRRRHNSFWVPAAGMEFGCILVNRIAKEAIRDDHAERLTELFADAPDACTAEVRRWFDGTDGEMILAAAKSGVWSSARSALPQLRPALLARAGGVMDRLWRGTKRAVRRIRRWLKPPNGLHVVFLGPDGVGKSTIIEAVERDLTGAFLGTLYQTFAPSLLPQRMQAKPSPHAYPPRGLFASLLKTGWWFCCYTIGYMVVTHPARARAKLVLNHRYLPDAIADSKRYRYGGPMCLLKMTWWIAPKPDLIILLDAPAEVIQARKTEVTPEETARQRSAYQGIVGSLPYTRKVDTSQPLPDAVAAVEGALFDVMAARAARVVRRFAP